MKLLEVTGQHEWESSYGPIIAIHLRFEDFWAELNTKPDYLAARLEGLEKVIGVDSDEWAFEDRGKFAGGEPKPKKVTSYPGKKPAPKEGDGGGGGGKYIPRYRDTEEGFSREQRSIHASVALEHAVKYATVRDTDVLELTTAFYRLLQDVSTSPPAGPPHQSSHAGGESLDPEPEPASKGKAPGGSGSGTTSAWRGAPNPWPEEPPDEA